MAKAASDAAAGEEYEACAGISEPMVSRGSTNKKLAELAVTADRTPLRHGTTATVPKQDGAQRPEQARPVKRLPLLHLSRPVFYGGL